MTIDASKIIKNIIVTLLILSLGISNAFLVYLHFFSSKDSDLSGAWIADLDMTEQAAVTALDWLQDIEAVSVSLEDMEPYMQDLTVQVELTMTQTARSEGTFSCAVLPESYEACNQAAYEAFAAAFRALLTKRLNMAGYLDGTDEEAVEALVEETFGMSTVSYLMTSGPALLPSLEELQLQYDGSGTYEATEGVLIRQFETGTSLATRVERYIREDSTLILSEESTSATSEYFGNHYPIVYFLMPENA
ncbi:MAG: hypothetical protein NC427_06815 [Ruminococcus flavefaciens]|nr:hypothetical protein [Ruminococcus flavefaciens]